MITRKPLVIVIDLDNDISEVLGVNMVKGEGEVLKAALTYSQERPEDADLNAIFSGLSLYRKLRDKGLNADIAVVGGDRGDIVEAQVKVKERVEALVKSYNIPVELYIVGDGLDEIMVADVLGDIAPIAAVKRVIVEQHAGVETSYALFLRYARKVTEDPRYSRYVLGVPGIIVAIIALLSLLNLISIAIKVSLLLLGIIMVIRGFNIENLVVRVLQETWNNLKETPHIRIAAATLFMILMVGGVSITYYTYKNLGFQDAIISLIGLGIPLILVGATLYVLLGDVMLKAVRGDMRVLNSIALTVILAFGAAAFQSLGSSFNQILSDKSTSMPEALIQALFYSKFIPSIITGIALAGFIELVMRILKRRAPGEAV